MATSDSTQPQEKFTDVLKNIQFDDPQQVSKKETGLKIGREIYKIQMGNSGVDSSGFFTQRNIKFKVLEDWSLGKQDMTQFLPFMNIVDANKSYAQIDMTPPAIGAQFVGTKVESIAKNVEYPCVTAIDDESLKEKDDRFWDAMHRMKEVETINDIQQQTGVQLEPSNVYVPNDEQSAKIYFELEDRLPKEIRFEVLLSDTLVQNDYERVIKPAMIRDNIVFGIECTQVEKVRDRTYTLNRVMPKTVFYNFFASDTGKTELTHIGRPCNLKISEVRKKWSNTVIKGGLTEKEIFEFARKSSQNNPIPRAGWNHQFGFQYNEYSGTTPWDDDSCFVIDFEIKILEDEYFVTKKDSYGKENVSPKNGIPKPQSETAVIQKKKKERWYRCVYSPYADMVIYWGKPDLTILDYTNTEQSFCSYSINIPNNNGEYAPSLFSRALEPLKKFCVLNLKQSLLIGKLSPAAYKVDVEAARSVLDGTGKVYDWEDLVRIKDQTGVELWSSKGLDPLTPNSPIFSAATQDPTLQNILGLQEAKERIMAEIRVLLGTPIYLDGSDVGQRTAARLAEGQSAGSFNVTGFIPNGHNQVMEETLHKICLLHWQDIVTDKKESENDLINTRFKIGVKMKMSDYEKEVMRERINKWSSTIGGDGKPLLSPKDAFIIEQIDNYKLAALYLANAIKDNEEKSEKKKQQDTDYTIKAQTESNKQTAENAKALQDEKIALDRDLAEFTSTKQKELELLKGFMAAAAKDETGTLIQQLMPAIQQLVPNITIPLMQENKQMQEQIIAQEQQQQMQQEQQEMSGGEQGQNMQQEMMEEQQVEQPQMQNPMV
jgi:hypothetical protein